MAVNLVFESVTRNLSLDFSVPLRLICFATEATETWILD